MRNLIFILFAFFVVPQLSGAEDSPLQTEADTLGYALGMDIGHSLKKMNPDVNLEFLAQGLTDAFSDKQMLLTPNQAYQIKNKFLKSRQNPDKEKRKQEADAKEKQQKMKENLLTWRKETAAKNLEIEKTFFKKNEKEMGVVTTESGLQYMVIDEGNGFLPTLQDIITIHYEGSSLNGKIFDSSYERKKTETFPLKRAIEGWQEVLQLMPVGSKYLVFVPARLAYGKNGSGSLIEPGEALIFEIKLLGIEDKKTYEKGQGKAKRIPPYTSELELREIGGIEQKQQSIVSDEDFSLLSIESATDAFMLLRNKLMPVSKKEDIKAICEAVAVGEYITDCMDILESYVLYLKAMPDLKGANFENGKREKSEGRDSAMDVSWEEVLFFQGGTSKTFNKHIRLWFEQVNSEWRVNKIEL